MNYIKSTLEELCIDAFPFFAKTQYYTMSAEDFLPEVTRVRWQQWLEQGKKPLVLFESDRYYAPVSLLEEIGRICPGLEGVNVDINMGIFKYPMFTKVPGSLKKISVSLYQDSLKLDGLQDTNVEFLYTRAYFDEANPIVVGDKLQYYICERFERDLDLVVRPGFTNHIVSKAGNAFVHSENFFEDPEQRTDIFWN